MAGSSPDKMISVAVLSMLGACDIDVRAIEFDPPPGARGLNGKMRVTTWQCTITHLDAAKPMVRAVRRDPAEAEFDARQRFFDMFNPKGNPKLDPVLDSAAKAAPKPKPKPPVRAVVAADDDDLDDLV